LELESSASTNSATLARVQFYAISPYTAAQIIKNFKLMSVGHYENFPVASVLLPAPLRHPVSVIYRFARSADDFADEGDLPAAERLAQLDVYRQELRRLEAGAAPQQALFSELGQIVRLYRLPLSLFHDLLDAFAQDVIKGRYADFAELMDYCRRSANPVGRLLLHLFGAATEENLKRSDAICSSLQLINFWQDVAIDWRKNRIYLPQDELERYGVNEPQIAAGDTSGPWKALMRFQVERARALMKSGAPLGRALPGRIGLEIRTIVEGGLRILEKIDKAEGDVYHHRPVLNPLDWPLLLLRAL
jgi:phytoene synthase